ncbi:MAG: ABC transporter permease subunit [Paracoccaceae bacterium]|nr:ABC transporter permease subunit [Paracoccaceae bacterium]
MLAESKTEAPPQPRSFRIDRELWIWLRTIAAAAAFLPLAERIGWLSEYPESWIVPVAGLIDLAMTWLVANFRWLFQGIAWLLSLPMEGIQALLGWTPWPISVAVFAGLAQVAGGWRLVAFTLFAMLYLVTFGYWVQSMNTLTLVFVAVPLAAAVGVFAGIWAYKSPTAERIVTPLLDIMQTVPMFAYLIPFLLFFGFGPVVGIVATAIYACPPMVRNVMLGLRRVPVELVESGVISGATRRQLLWHVELPSALPSIMMGLNQTIMQALNMVIIAAVIGSTVDMGWEVLSKMRKAQFGESLVAGVVVALLAMMIDRISRGLAMRSQTSRAGEEDAKWWLRVLWPMAAIMALLFAVAEFVPNMSGASEFYRKYPSDWTNSALEYFLVTYPNFTDNIKNSMLFFFMLPLKLGLETTVKPFTWGFAWTPTLTAIYVALVALAAALLGWFSGWRSGIAVVLIGAILLIGIVNIPWPAFILVMTVLAWQLAGWGAGTFTACGLLFMVVTGVWAPAINSIYLCGASVIVSFVFGGLIGVWAANNDFVSAIVRPIIDTLQTMPLFVFLIPILMFFQVGELPAFMAITAYSIVAAIRYVEHALRYVPHAPVEAAEASGCSRFQLLWFVKIPLSLPEILLGLNQTIMFALQMLAISALVGSRELAQELYIALSNAEAGQGLVAGFSIALIAMISDRIIQAWSASRKAMLGL